MLIAAAALMLGACANTEDPVAAAAAEQDDSAAAEDGEQMLSAAAAEEESVEPMGGQSESDESGFEQAKPMLREQLMQQKQSEVLMSHLAELRDDADMDFDIDAYEDGDEDTVIATVNGRELVKSDIQAVENQQAANMGMDPTSDEARAQLESIRPQIIEQLVSTLLLEDKAETEGFEATEEQIDEQYTQFAQQYGGEEALSDLLDQQGLTEADLRDDIAAQLPVQLYVTQYLEDNFDEDSVVITDEELRELYETQQQQQQQMPQPQPQQ